MPKLNENYQNVKDSYLFAEIARRVKVYEETHPEKAADIIRLGIGDVTLPLTKSVIEALHEAGGVLVYGIPEFRLPKLDVVAKEVENVKALGVKIETNVVIGKAVTIDELMEKEGFEAVFIGSGAGLPRFMGIPGEQAMGVFSANEFLTRNNLMKAFRDDYDTPIKAGKKVVVVGGGNVAMDAARTAKRLGAEVHIVYRRGEEELPARKEEVHHAKEEGIIFDLLQNPTEILVDEDGWVKGCRVIKMELGEPDASELGSMFSQSNTSGMSILKSCAASISHCASSAASSGVIACEKK